MQDPYFAVKEEVEHSVTVVVDLHKRWLELSTDGKRGDEFEWTSSELLSGLRSIEWDLQDLEDTVSIVEGNRQKFQLEESDLEERKQFIDATRRQIVSMRDEVQGQASNATPGFSTAKGGPGIPSIGGKKQGYGKVGSQEDEILGASSEAIGSMESGGRAAPVQHAVSDGADEILGGELEMGVGVPQQPKGRHRRKKACLVALLLIIVAGVAAGVLLSAGGADDAPASSLPPPMPALNQTSSDAPVAAQPASATVTLRALRQATSQQDDTTRWEQGQERAVETR